MSPNGMTGLIIVSSSLAPQSGHEVSGLALLKSNHDIILP